MPHRFEPHPFEPETLTGSGRSVRGRGGSSRPPDVAAGLLDRPEPGRGSGLNRLRELLNELRKKLRT